MIRSFEPRTHRIHDLRHMATSILFPQGIPEAIIRKLTGHRSRELAANGYTFTGEGGRATGLPATPRDCAAMPLGEIAIVAVGSTPSPNISTPGCSWRSRLSRSS